LGVNIQKFRSTVAMGHGHASPTSLGTHRIASTAAVNGTDSERRRDGLDTDRRGIESSGPGA
jgi:hypothetical protein